MGWLRAEMDDQYKSLVSMLWCVFVGNMRIKHVGSKTSQGYKSRVQATIK